MVIPHQRACSYALLTRAPLYSLRRAFSCDLHVLSTPPAFVLSQDQTLTLKMTRTISCSLWINIRFILLYSFALSQKSSITRQLPKRAIRTQRQSLPIKSNSCHIITIQFSKSVPFCRCLTASTRHQTIETDMHLQGLFYYQERFLSLFSVF